MSTGVLLIGLLTVCLSTSLAWADPFGEASSHIDKYESDLKEKFDKEIAHFMVEEQKKVEQIEAGGQMSAEELGARKKFSHLFMKHLFLTHALQMQGCDVTRKALSILQEEEPNSGKLSILALILRIQLRALNDAIALGEAIWKHMHKYVELFNARGGPMPSIVGDAYLHRQYLQDSIQELSEREQSLEEKLESVPSGTLSEQLNDYVDSVIEDQRHDNQCPTCKALSELDEDATSESIGELIASLVAEYVDSSILEAFDEDESEDEDFTGEEIDAVTSEQIDELQETLVDRMFAQ